ncbi:MAG: hypothetical protein MJ173_05855 [Clostridia bacterium]|nr:hypothetical protein [Clostridia bacterium]
MSEIINIIALNAENNESDISELKHKLEAEGIEYSFMDFDSPEGFASTVASADKTVLSCCSKEDFSAAKLALINSLSRRVGKSASIIAAMDCNTPDEQSEYNIHAALPEGGTAYPSSDGMYSGFSCPIDGGTLFFMTYDSKTSASVLESGMMAALKKAANPVEKKTAVEEFRECVEGIIGNGKTIAIAGSGSFKPLVSAISSVPGWEKVFRPDSTVAERGSKETNEEYCARCAKESKEASESELGISISDITESDEGKFITVSVADSIRAKGAKVFAKSKDEDPMLLISASVIKLCEMLDEFSLTGIPDEEAPFEKKSRLPIIIVLSAIIAAMIICGFIAVKSFAGRDKLSASVKNSSETAVEDGNDFFNLIGGVGLDDSEIPEETSAENIPALATVLEITGTSAISTTVKETITATLLSTAKATTAVPTTAAPKTDAPTTAAATTAKAPETSGSAATTAKETASKSTTAAATTAKAPESGTKAPSSGTGGKWIFRVYGWGHGVGMSQEGAIAMAKNGSSYVDILENFYTGCSVKTDSGTPKSITYGGKSIPIVEYLCRTTYAEIGATSQPEALKAQAVCAYTFAKYYKFNVASSKHAYKSSFDYKGTAVYNAVLAVLGMSSESDTPKAKYVDYNGSAAFTCYFDSSPGKTTSATSVWGGGNYPYLTGGNISPEEPRITTVEITVDQMKNYIQSYAKEKGKTINLDSNPENWVRIESHDSAVNSTTGYVEYIYIGDYKVRGNEFRSNVLDMKIRSHCFSMEYVA